MSRRISLEAIVSTAIQNSGATKESVAQAADITVAELDSYLSTEGSMPVSVLRRVGGFLRFEAPDVMEESYANH